MHVLVIEDERKIATLICKYLELNAYSHTHLSSGVNAASIIVKSNIDIVLLDIMLPDIDGFDVCRNIRKSSNIPIVMLTARVNEIDKLLGFDLGIDDYVCKPFSPQELMARIRSVLRRARGSNEIKKQVESVNGVEIDTTSNRATVNGQLVNLTQNEFLILQALLKRPTKDFTRKELLTSIHGQYFDGYERNIDTHVKNLRRKLYLHSSGKQYIESIYGVGYRFM